MTHRKKNKKIMENLLVIQENEFSVSKSMHPCSSCMLMQTNSSQVMSKYVSQLHIFIIINLHAKNSHMPNMPRGRTSPDLPADRINTRVIYRLYVPDNSVNKAWRHCHFWLARQ